MSFSNNQPLPPLAAAGNEPIIEPPISQRITAGNFDLEAAIKARYTPSEIAKFLSDQVGYDYENGIMHFSDDEIIALTSKQLESIPDVRAVSKPAAAVEGTIRGLMVGTPATYGAIRLGMMGARAGMFSPWPYLTAPLGAIAGGLVGLFGGSGIGGAIEDVLMPEEPVGPEARPYLEGGKTFGATLPSVIIPYKVPIEGINLGSRMYMSAVADMTEPSVKRALLSVTGKTLGFLEKGFKSAAGAAQATPRMFGTAETMAAAGAGVGGGIAESRDPGAIGTRLLYETLGGFFAPKKTLINFYPAVRNSFLNITEPLTRAGRQDYAGRKLREVFEQTGEDPAAAIEALRSDPKFMQIAREMGLGEGELPPALYADFEALRRIQNSVVEGFPGLSAEMKQATKDNLDVMQAIISTLRQQGDPESISLAAQMRQGYFEDLLIARLNVANARALQTAEKIPATQGQAIQQGQTVERLADTALKEARAQERALYQNVDRTAPVDLGNDSAVLEAYKNLVAEHGTIIPAQMKRAMGLLFPEIGEAATREAQLADNLANAQQKLQSLDDTMLDSYGLLSSDMRFILRRRLEKMDIDTNDVLPRSRLAPGESGIPETLPEASLERVIALRDEISNLSRNGSFSYRDVNNAVQTEKVSPEAKKQLVRFLNSMIDKSNTQRNLTEVRTQAATPPDQTIAGEPSTVGNMMDFRSQMRQLGADAAAQKDFQTANFYGRLNEAALDDLETLVMREAEDGADRMAQPLFQAYQFSRALNDVFRRAFAGDVLAKDAEGMRRILPETMAVQLFSEGNDAVALRSRQLQEAVRFMTSPSARAVDAPIPENLSDRIGTMDAALQDMLRYTARNTVNPDTGQVNPQALATFLRDNDEVLKMFPALQQDLQNAQTAQRLLADVTDANSYSAKVIQNQSAFAKFLNAPDNPAQTLQTMLGSPGSRKGDAVQAFRKLIRFAGRDSNPEVMDGLLDTVLERAYMYAGGSDAAANFNFNKFKAYLYEPLGKNKPSIMEIMREMGVIPEKTVGQLRVALDQADLANKVASDSRTAGTRLVDAPSKIADTLAAVFGTEIGSRITAMIPFRNARQGLIEQSAVAGVGREWLTRMPLMQTKDIFAQAIKDPELMALLIEKAPTPKRRLELLGKFNAYLNGIGIRWLSEDEQGQMEQGLSPDGTAPQQEEAPQQPRPAVPAPQQAPIQQAPQPVAQAPMQPPMSPLMSPPQSAPNLQQRQQYAAMFPYEPTSEMIRGGIGSLA